MKRNVGGQLREEAQEAVHRSGMNHCSGDLGLVEVPQPGGREDGRVPEVTHMSDYSLGRR